jgi:outer membrane protein OmpA-like peptidoglycan-associated protein
VAISTAALERLLQTSSSDASIDRQALARLLTEIARNVDASVVAQSAGLPSFDPRLERLRTLLLGQEIESLSRLRGKIDDPEQLAAAVSEVLSAAIAQASARDTTLGDVLAPALERATQNSIRSDPHTLINILYPLILPAIRKSIGEAIDGTFQSLNESLKYSLSWRGLQWRWEAWRTGVPFAAVVLKHTLIFQVEHAFLIHRHTGLLIAHVAADHAASQDPQIVSSMLVAIQDFVRDSFSGAGQQSLDTLRLGDLMLWSEPGPFAALVAVIRGNPPESLHDDLQQLLSRIHAQRAQALQAFDGDSSTLADVDAQLQECVQWRQRASSARTPRRPLLAPIIGAAMLALLGWGLIAWWLDAHAFRQYVDLLRTQPGIVVTDSDRHHGRWQISGLRDPVAIDPMSLLQKVDVNPQHVVEQWQPYQGLNPPLVLKRMVAVLNSPSTISFSVAGDQIVAHGSASLGWLQRARSYVANLPDGAPRVDLSQVQDLSKGALGALRDAIQSKAIRFGYNEALPAASENALLDELARELQQLETLAASQNVTPRVTVTGHSDATGKGTQNLSLSLARAEAVRALLKKRNVNPDLLSIRGAGPLEPLDEEATDAARSINRRVSLTVSVDD